jgi:predicted ATP-dependent serine protease
MYAVILFDFWVGGILSMKDTQSIKAEKVSTGIAELDDVLGGGAS